MFHMKGELMRLERNVDSFLHAHESSNRAEIWSFMSDLRAAILGVIGQVKNLEQTGMYYKSDKKTIENNLNIIVDEVYARLSEALEKQVLSNRAEIWNLMSCLRMAILGVKGQVHDLEQHGQHYRSDKATIERSLTTIFDVFYVGLSEALEKQVPKTDQ